MFWLVVEVICTGADFCKKMSDSLKLSKNSSSSDIYTILYKPIKLLLRLLNVIIDGDYVPLGVCNYYNDNSLKRFCFFVVVN
jgi:hypothetical protein